MVFLFSILTRIYDKNLYLQIEDLNTDNVGIKIIKICLMISIIQLLHLTL